MIFKILYSRLKRIGYIKSEIPLLVNRNCIAEIQGTQFFCQVLTQVHSPVETTNVALRIADEADEIHWDLQVRRSYYFTNKANEYAKEKRISCKILASEPSFDLRKMFFYFSSDSVLSIKELITYCTSFTKVDVDFRNIEGREKARLIGGLGVCGKEPCCTKFLFEIPVISKKDVEGLWKSERDYLGMCERIKCCATFEKRNFNTNCSACNNKSKGSNSKECQSCRK